MKGRGSLASDTTWQKCVYSKLTVQSIYYQQKKETSGKKFGNSLITLSVGFSRLLMLIRDIDIFTSDATINFL